MINHQKSSALFLVAAYNPCSLLKTMKKLLQISSRLPSAYSVEFHIACTSFDSFRFANSVNFNNIRNSGALKVYLVDNTFHEFGAYQFLYHISLDRSSADARVVNILLNDTFAVGHNITHSVQKVIEYSIIECLSASQPIVYGFTDQQPFSANKEYSLEGSDVRSWLSSYFFILNGPVFLRMSKLLNVELMKYYTPSVGTTDWNFSSSSISGDLQNHLKEWLFKPGNWSKAGFPTSENMHLLEPKLFCILNELWFTAELKRNKIRILSLPGGCRRSIHKVIANIDLKLFKFFKSSANRLKKCFVVSA